MNRMDILMTTKELAEFLRLNEKKIYQLVKEGNIPHVRIAGKWLFPKKHILNWIDEMVQREKDILIVGSDDILLARLLTHYSKEQFPKSLAFYSPIGSAGGVQALAQSKGHACCVHILDFETGEYNLPFLSRNLSRQKYVVINLWHRKQGLIVKKNNPSGIKRLEDVFKNDLKFANRNKGSGTRLLVEYLLSKRGLDFAKINGFDEELETHMEVALKVFFGESDVGLGIEYVTHLLPLDFIPLQEERFDLVISKDFWPTDVIKNFAAYIDREHIRKISDTLPGYNFKDTGKIIFES